MRTVVIDALGFWGLGLLAAIFLGADYYFAAHYLNSQQVFSYHLAMRIFLSHLLLTMRTFSMGQGGFQSNLWNMEWVGLLQ